MEQLLEAAPVQVFDAKALTVTAPEMKTAFTISSIHRMAMTDLHKGVRAVFLHTLNGSLSVGQRG